MDTKKPGRPPQVPHLLKIPVGYKLPFWFVAWLRSQPKPAAQIIEDAVRQVHHCKPE